MKIVWRCETTAYGILFDGSCIVGEGQDAKKFGSVETIPHTDFTTAQIQSVLNKITEDIIDMVKEAP